MNIKPKLVEVVPTTLGDLAYSDVFTFTDNVDGAFMMVVEGRYITPRHNSSRLCQPIIRLDSGVVFWDNPERRVCRVTIEAKEV